MRSKHFFFTPEDGKGRWHEGARGEFWGAGA